MRSLREIAMDAASGLERGKRDPELAAELLAAVGKIGRPKDPDHVDRLLAQRDRMLERIGAGEGEDAVVRSVAARMGGTEMKWRNVLKKRRADVRAALEAREQKIRGT